MRVDQVFRAKAPAAQAPTTVQHESAQLQHEAERDARRAREIALHQARQLVEFWGIEARELDGRALPRRRAPAPAPAAAIKYQHPLTGEAWNGVGLQPDWLRHALLKEGYRLDEVRPGTPDFERLAQRR